MYLSEEDLASIVLNGLGLTASQCRGIRAQNKAISLLSNPARLIQYFGNSRLLEENDPKEILESRVKSLTDAISCSGQWRESIHYFLKMGGQVVGVDQLDDLDRLINVKVPPYSVFLRGKASLIKKPFKIAIVGTRSPSVRGAQRAFVIAQELTKMGALIVSGGALGVDMQAHKGALAANGETLVVLGSPLVHKRDERPMRVRALQPNDKVTTFTCFGPWIKSAPALFASRNQYVAALADAVVVVEGLKKSGTLHTARYARSLGVGVWAVPGDPSIPLSAAPNYLISKGYARMFVDTKQFLQDLKGQVPALKKQLILRLKGSKETCSTGLLPNVMGSGLATIDCLDPIQKRLKGAQSGCTFDQLLECTGTNPSLLQENLLLLELEGKIIKEGACFFWAI